MKLLSKEARALSKKKADRLGRQEIFKTEKGEGKGMMVNSVTAELNRSSCCCNSPAQIRLMVIVVRAAANSGWRSHFGFPSLLGIIHTSSSADVATSQYRWSTFCGNSYWRSD